MRCRSDFRCAASRWPVVRWADRLPTVIAAAFLAGDARNLTILREAELVHRFVKVVGAPPTVPVRASGLARISLAVPTYLYELNAVRARTQQARRRATLAGNPGPTLGSNPGYTGARHRLR